MKKTVNYEGKEYNVFQFKSNIYGKVNLIFVKQRYEDNGSLAVEAIDVKGMEPWATMTVNLHDPEQVRPNHAFFDVNNSLWLLGPMKELGLVKQAENGHEKQSGFVTYPLYEWNVNLFRVGGEKKKYYVDCDHYRDGRMYGDLGYHFDVRPETETEDIKEAKRIARYGAKNEPFDEEVGIEVFSVVDEDGKVYFTAVNVDKETAEKAGLKADEYYTPAPSED